MNKVKIKKVEPIIAATLEGHGKIPDFNKDIDRLYEYLYSHGLGEHICGPTIGLFYTEHGGKYVVAVPVKQILQLEGQFKVDTLPALECTSLIHSKGPQTIEESFNVLKEYRKEHNMQWVFPVREIYIPSKEEKGEYITEIQVPIE